MDGFANVSFTIELSPAWIVGILGSIVSLIVLLRLIYKARRKPRFGGYLLAGLFLVLLFVGTILNDLGYVDRIIELAGRWPVYAYGACTVVTATWSLGLMEADPPADWKKYRRRGILWSLLFVFCIALIPATSPWRDEMQSTVHLVIWISAFVMVVSIHGILVNVMGKGR